MESPTLTITPKQVLEGFCVHCQAHTVQVKGGRGLVRGTLHATACLQCIADGGTCCSLERLNRWKQTE